MVKKYPWRSTVEEPILAPPAIALCEEIRSLLLCLSQNSLWMPSMSSVLKSMTKDLEQNLPDILKKVSKFVLYYIKDVIKSDAV